jgi:hypothetical protein
MKKILHRAFIGGIDGRQSTPFLDAMKSFLKNNPDADFEILTCKSVKERKLSPKQFVDFFLDGNAHYFAAHLHQNIFSILGWNISDLHNEIQRLFYHVGYPFGKKLNDSTFLQNKYQLVRVLGENAITTLKFHFDWLDIDGNVSNKQFMHLLHAFLAQNTEGAGWVVKLPYTTNGEGVNFCPTVENVLSTLKELKDKFGDLIDYCMVQPRLINRYEHKLVYFDGVFFQHAHNHVPLQSYESWEFGTEEEIKSFCCQIIEQLKKTYPDFLLQPMLRIDVMQTRDGKLVVNEMESLDALTSAKGRGGEKGDLNLNSMLRQFWLSYFGRVHEHIRSQIQMNC